MRRFALAWILLTAIAATALEREPLEQYKLRRQKLASQLDGVVALYAALATDLVQYQQEDNFYYLTGFDEPGAILLLDATGDSFEEILFIPPRDQDEERWTGEKLGPGPRAVGATGVTSVEALEEFASQFQRMLEKTDAVYTLTDQEDNVLRLRKIAPGADIGDLAPSLALNRQVKTASELAILTKAIDITMKAHAAAAGVIAPNVAEYEVEATIEFEFRRNGAERPAFPSIVGSGPNATILHYDRNTRKMAAGDLVVADIGAEYGGYAADITRTYPVGGKFTERQREIYQIVLDAQKAALARVKPGATIGGRGSNSIHEAARQHIQSKGYGDHFIHGTSHHIGLEVHDVGPVGRPLEPNMVITVEPGIYIPDENIGVRIEDDVLVTETGYRILSDFPREIDEIEALMARQRIRDP